MPRSLNTLIVGIFDRKQGVFFMEGMWTRFFPAVRKVRELIHSGAVGNIKTVLVDFGYKCPRDIDRLYDPKLGGGSLMDIGEFWVGETKGRAKTEERAREREQNCTHHHVSDSQCLQECTASALCRWRMAT
jgi:hypothetical protein